MKIRVQSIHFDADQKLLDFIQKKADKLDLFYDGILSGEVYLKLEKSDVDENKVTEIKVNVPGHTLFSKSQSKTFEVAADEAVESMKAQLQRLKDKVKEHASNHKSAL